MKSKREVITLHFGQAGIQIGDAVWQTMAGEHCISPNGQATSTIKDMEESGMNVFFHVGPNDQHIPRTLMVDSEPTVIDEIRTGYFRNLFHPDLMMTGKEDAANNFSRGYYSISQKMIYSIIDKCRYIAETCDNFQGFMSYSACGGGTGSGLFSMFLERALIEYSSKIFIGNVIVPGKTLSNCVVDPYNTVLRLSKSVGGEDLNFILDNESLYSICTDLDIARPTYHDINKVLSPLFSTVTAPIRFGGPLTGAFNEISTNLIPYPRINFPTMSYTPFLSTDASSHDAQSCNELTMSLFDKSNNLLKQNLFDGLFMSSVLIYRGHYVINDIIQSVYSLKALKKCQWVDWCPTGFKITQTNFPALHSFSPNMAQPSKSILMLCNHSVVLTKFNQVCKKFNLLYRKKSYLHWYISEGMEEKEFSNALDDISRITMDYEHICENHRIDMASKPTEVIPSTEIPIRNYVTEVKNDLLSISSEMEVGENLEEVDIEKYVKKYSSLDHKSYDNMSSETKLINNDEV